jgi:Tfp pilus assembly protein FimT
MVELMIVIVIILVISGMAMPSITRSITMIRLRESVGGVAGMLQRTRIEAVRKNRYMVARYKTVDKVNFVYLDANQNDVMDGGSSGNPAEPVVQFGRDVQYMKKPASPPMAFPSKTLLGYNQTESDSPFNAGFTQRGLPCTPNSGSGTVTDCPNSGQLYYFKAASTFGDRWGALTITPAGRIRVWTYSESAGWN